MEDTGHTLKQQIVTEWYSLMSMELLSMEVRARSLCRSAPLNECGTIWYLMSCLFSEIVMLSRIPAISWIHINPQFKQLIQQFNWKRLVYFLFLNSTSFNLIKTIVFKREKIYEWQWQIYTNCSCHEFACLNKFNVRQHIILNRR